MPETTERLIKCFIAVFPGVDPERIEAAGPATVDEWDSIATVTLMSVLEEEFRIEVDPDDIEHLLSFPLALAYVNRRLGTGATA